METVQIHLGKGITVVVHVTACIDWESEDHISVQVDTGYVATRLNDVKAECNSRCITLSKKDDPNLG